MSKEEIALEILKAALQRDVFKYVNEGQSYAQSIAEAYNTILETINVNR